MAVRTAASTVNFLFVTLVFLDVTSVFRKCGHVAVLGAEVSKSSGGSGRRHFSRKDIHNYLSLSDNSQPYHLKGLFSALVHRTIDLKEEKALSILLPALEEFENAMIEEAYRVRITLQDHSRRLARLEALLGQRHPQTTVTPSGISSTSQRPVDKLDIPLSDSSNSSSVPSVKNRSEKKDKHFVKQKKTSRRGDVAVTEIYVSKNNMYDKTEDENGDKITGNKTKDDDESIDISSEGLNNKTGISVFMYNNETDIKINETDIKVNETDIKVNETDATVNGTDAKSKETDTKVTKMAPTVNQTDTTESKKDSITKKGSRIVVKQIKRVNIHKFKKKPMSNTTTEAKPEVVFIESLKMKVQELELFRKKSSQIQNKSDVKVKQLEKSIGRLRGRFRKLRSRVSSQNNKINNLEGERFQREQTPDQYGSQYASYFTGQYTKMDGRVDNLRDLVIRSRGEIRELKQVTEKHEQYIRELQSGSNEQEHQLREMMARLLSIEQTVRNVYNSVDSHMTALRWEVQVMLDNVCSNNNLHC